MTGPQRVGRVAPRVAPKMRRESDAERGFATLVKWAGLPEPEREVMLIPGRQFRFDFVWRSRMIALEVDGGGFVGGRHGTGIGMERDAEKQSLAAAMGYRVLRVTPRHIEDGKAIEWLRAALEGGR